MSEDRALSFGAVADDYDRLRPAVDAAALDWLVPADTNVAVDLAAGTGLFTRALAPRVARVIAVEPDPRMRAVLAHRSPDIETTAGTAEDIPLPDASVDLVTVSSAWHWFDPPHAVPEIARILRDGGRLAVVWTGRDHDNPWWRELARRVNEPAHRGDGSARGSHHVLALPAGSALGEPEEHTVTFTRRMPVEDVVSLLATYSGVITMTPAQRAAALDAARQSLVQRYGATADVEVPLRSRCYRCERLAR